MSILYAKSWDAGIPVIDIGLSDLIEHLPHLLQSGGAGLIWPRIRHRAEEYGAVGEMLEHTYQQYLDALEQIEQDIPLIISMLAEAGIAAVLVKGWSLSRLYELPMVRRPGDIDLIVPNDSYTEARLIIGQAYGKGLRTSVDLKSDAAWRSRPYDDFRHHLEYVQCGGVRVPILSASDALRAVSIHFTKHFRGFLATSSPLWLCDVSLLIERPTSELDWERVLGPDDDRRQWVLVAVALARDVVGADVSQLPAIVRDFPMPEWACDALLQQWLEPMPSPRVALSRYGLIGGFKALWPNPLTATLACNVNIDDQPHRRHQYWTYVRRLALYCAVDLPRHKLGPRLGWEASTWLVDD